MLFHPALDDADIQRVVLALEAFLLVTLVERSEVAVTVGKLGVEKFGLRRGAIFLARYDLTYGSLRLTGRIQHCPTLQEVLAEAVVLAQDGRIEGLEPPNEATLQAIQAMHGASLREERPLVLGDGGLEITPQDEDSIVVIMPGSTGWIVTDDNQEFGIERVFFSPRDGMVYGGSRPGLQVKALFPVANIEPIPGVSKLGRYNLATGDLEEME